MTAQLPALDESYLTITEIATALRISKMTVYRLINVGHLPAIRVGRSFRIPKSAFDRYVAGSVTTVGAA